MMGSSSGKKSELDCCLNEIDLQNEKLVEFQNKYNEKTLSLSRMTKESDELHLSFYEETRKLHGLVREHVKKVLDEQESMNNEHVNKKKRLDNWSMELEKKEQSLEFWKKELENREALSKVERRKFEAEKKKIPLNQMKEMIDNLEALEGLNYQLVTQERRSNGELQEAREELIKNLPRLPLISHANIGIKRMGEIDMKAFKNVNIKRYSSGEEEDDEDEKMLILSPALSLRLRHIWQEKLRNPRWHPFQIVKDSNGNAQHIVNEDDKILVELKKQYGDETFDYVVTALKEIQLYSPSGRCVVPELWNFLENRKATLKEAITCTFDHMKNLKCN